MEYSCLPKKVQERVKKPFTFISYCHQNKETYDRVQALVTNLRRQKINVVYDEGGLEPGTELTQFVHLILSDNCKKVLVVCDKEYLNKINENTGGAWEEYFIISNDYHNNAKKYIPLYVDAMIPIFSSKIYIPYKDDSSYSKIQKILYSLKEKNDSSQVSVKDLVRDANKLCDNGDYSAALNKINKAIEICNQRRTKTDKAELYNLKLVICINKRDTTSAISVADELKRLIAHKPETVENVQYYTNCALAYRMMSSTSDEYEDCAKMAYAMSKKYGVKDDGYYACMYGTALFELEQYADAYRYVKQALEEFVKEHENISSCLKKDYIMYAKIKGNLAETAVAYCKSVCRGKKKKLSILLEAQMNILDIINIKDLEDEDALKVEMYSIAIKVFEALREFFS